MTDVVPKQVLKRVAEAIPAQCRGNIIIVGSLAAGYLLLRGSKAYQVRTKDIDCVLSPRIAAVDVGTTVAETLIANGWRQRTEGEHARPGSASTPNSRLPAIRLFPPNSSDWFMELLTVPGPKEKRGLTWARVILKSGHFGLPSFGFLSLAEYKPRETQFDIRCARPEMMALANLMEHPKIGDAVMSGLIAERAIKRSNKDLGRVITIAHLSRDEDIELWSETWQEALHLCFPQQWRRFARRAGSGLRDLLKRPRDLEEAFFTCKAGLLAHWPITIGQFRITAERILHDAIGPLEKQAGRTPRPRTSTRPTGRTPTR